MLKGVAYVIAYYTIGIVLSALSYWTYGHSYAHAPGLYHFILFLTFLGGLVWTFVAVIRHFAIGASPRLKGILISNTVVILLIASVTGYFIAKEQQRDIDRQRDEISVSQNGDTTILYHSDNIIYLKVKDSVLLNMVDSARLAQILDSAGIANEDNVLKIEPFVSAISENASFFARLKEPQDDSTTYIGELDLFDASGEFYTPVFYRPEIDPSTYHDRLAESADSVVFEDGDMQRSRLPYKIAKRVFNLSGLQRISIFHKGHYVTDAEFVGVELLQGMIESRFIAVFKPVSKTDRIQAGMYCVSSKRKNDLTQMKADFESIEEEALTAHICKTLAIDTKSVQGAVHIKMDDHKIYSAISLTQGAFLTETEEGRSHILKEIKEDYYLIDILPTHLAMNGKPMMLIQMGVNETDMIWTSLAVFTGREYEFVERNRVVPGR